MSEATNKPKWPSIVSGIGEGLAKVTAELERNSERKALWVAIVVAVLGSLGVIAGALLYAGALDPWPAAVVVASGLVGLSTIVGKMQGAVGEYAAARPEKTRSITERMKAAAEEARRLDPTQLPQSGALPPASTVPTSSPPAPAG